MAKPSAYEQYMLELINRARSNPEAEAQAYGIELNAGLAANTITTIPKQPLAFDELLIDSGRNHSEWMLIEDIFSHAGENGSRAGDRMTKAGYEFVGNWIWGENLAWIGVNGSLAQNATIYIEQQHRNLLHSPSHRLNIFTDRFREIGIGVLRGEFTSNGITYNSVVTTQNYAKSGSDKYLTGVVFDDLILDDDFYTVGEGLGGITVTATRRSDQKSFAATTYDTGGYQIALDSGIYDVTFAGATLAQSVTKTVTVEQQNFKLDLITDTIGLTTNSIAPLNSAPESLNFKLDRSQYISQDKLTITEGWVKDINGTGDLVKIDFWLGNDKNQWIDIADVIEFNPWSSQPQWSKFQYELDLNGFAQGKYYLWGQAIDSNNQTSDAFVQSFQLEQSWLEYQLKQKSFDAGQQLEIVDGWIKNYDRVERVDIWLLDHQTQQWLNAGDVVDFHPLIQAQWSSFDYSLDLNNHQAGKYSLWARAFNGDRSSSNEVLKSFQINNSAPHHLTIKLDQTSYTVSETLVLSEAWLVDSNGVNDLAKVDFYLLTADGSWIDLEDAIEFRKSDQEKIEFSYSLDLSDYKLGKYKLWAAAYDVSGAASNQVTTTFEIVSDTNSAVAGDGASYQICDRALLQTGFNCNCASLAESLLWESHLTEAKLNEDRLIDFIAKDSQWLI